MGCLAECGALSEEKKMSLPTQEKVVDFVHNARQKVTEAVEKVKMPTPLRLRDLIRQVRKRTS